MCGIWALFGYDSHDVTHFSSAFKIAHRGPDCYQLQNINLIPNCLLAFHRLCIVDNVRGMQPMRLRQYPHLTLICNGEIYNFKELKEEFDYQFETACDVEIILHLYEHFGAKKTAQLLDGVFSFLILDTRMMKVSLGRDSYGVRPMFYFFSSENGTLGVCSEAKGLVDILKTKNGEVKSKLIEIFPPAHCMVFNVSKEGKVKLEEESKFHSFYDRPIHWKYQGIELIEGDDISKIHANIRSLFTNAVEKRLMSIRRVGSLLSGGLDSSLVAAITAKKLKERQCKEPLQTFSIGFSSSPDIEAARKVAKHIGSEHHEVIITPEEALEALEEVIYTLESFDVINIRSGIPMYLMCKYIKTKTDTVVIMSGEGADEVCQGYAHFQNLSNPEEGDKESRRYLKELYLFDVLRCDRSTSAHGLEVRVPFLDHAFGSYYLSLPAKLRTPTNGIEKFLLRSAFDDQNLIPAEILWRKKKGFSKGIGSTEKPLSFFLQEHIECKVTDEQLRNSAIRFPHLPPKSKEEYYYRQVFEKQYGADHSRNFVPHMWKAE